MCFDFLSKYFFVLIGFFCVFLPFKLFSSQKIPDDQIDYHFSWDGKSTILDVDVYYNSLKGDTTTFIYGNPNPGGLISIFSIISGISSGEGDKILVDTAERKIKIIHQSYGLKHLHYRIDGRLYKDLKRARPNEAFRPTIEPGFFYSLGYNLFLESNNKMLTKLGVVWDLWPENMPYFISSNPEAKPGDLQLIRNENRNSLLIQMNKDLVVGKYVRNGIPNYLITSKSDTTTDMQSEMKPFINNFIPQMREFWKDNSFDFYFVSLIPLLNNVSSTMTGIGLNNGFSTRYTGGLDTEKIVTIAHEVSHTWIGGRLDYSSKSMENEWFNEGFDDYVAIYNLAKIGMVDKNAVIKYINKDIFEAYYKNPENGLAADSIGKYFWTGRNFEKIPYHRGFIYAFYLDNQIRIATANKSTIKDFLRILLLQSKQKRKKKIDTDFFTNAINVFLPKRQVSSEIKTYMLEGNLFDFHKIQLSNEFQLYYVDEIPQIGISADQNMSSIFR